VRALLAASSCTEVVMVNRRTIPLAADARLRQVTMDTSAANFASEITELAWWTVGAMILAPLGPPVKAFRFDSLSIARPTTGLMSPRSRPPPMFQAITSNTINRLPTNRSMSFDNSFTQRLGAISKASNGILSKCPVWVKLRPRGLSKLGPLFPQQQT